MNPVAARRFLAQAAVTVAATALLVPVGADGAADARPASPIVARAAGSTVTVADMAFTPASVTAALGDRVTWAFQDSITHTTTADGGFWDSGTRSSGSAYAHRFRSAGTFAYHCSIHPMMRGKVLVPVRATRSQGSAWTLRWSTKKGHGATTFTVQVRRGSGRWRPLVSGVRAAGRSFDPDRSGHYSLRARTLKGAGRSGWSPPVTVTVS